MLLRTAVLSTVAELKNCDTDHVGCSAPSIYSLDLFRSFAKPWLDQTDGRPPRGKERSLPLVTCLSASCYAHQPLFSPCRGFFPLVASASSWFLLPYNLWCRKSPWMVSSSSPHIVDFWFQPLSPPSSPLSSFQTLGMSRVHLFLLGHNRCLCSATGFLRSSGGSNRSIGLAWT